MSIKASYTEHESETRLRFLLTGEAELARRIAVTEDLLEILGALSDRRGMVGIGFTGSAREVLRAALKLYWTDLGEAVALLGEPVGASPEAETPPSAHSAEEGR